MLTFICLIFRLFLGNGVSRKIAFEIYRPLGNDNNNKCYLYLEATPIRMEPKNKNSETLGQEQKKATSYWKRLL